MNVTAGSHRVKSIKGQANPSAGRPQWRGEFRGIKVRRPDAASRLRMAFWRRVRPCQSESSPSLMTRLISSLPFILFFFYFFHTAGLQTEIVAFSWGTVRVQPARGLPPILLQLILLEKLRNSIQDEANRGNFSSPSVILHSAAAVATLKASLTRCEKLRRWFEKMPPKSVGLLSQTHKPSRGSDADANRGYLLKFRGD